MKSVVFTRKLKEKLCDHLKKGGVHYTFEEVRDKQILLGKKHNRPIAEKEELARVSLEERQECANRWYSKNGYTMIIDDPWSSFKLTPEEEEKKKVEIWMKYSQKQGILKHNA
jgi:ribosome biogenesis SPOUT family RNA methylase Rps3